MRKVMCFVFLLICSKVYADSTYAKEERRQNALRERRYRQKLRRMNAASDRAYYRKQAESARVRAMKANEAYYKKAAEVAAKPRTNGWLDSGELTYTTPPTPVKDIPYGKHVTYEHAGRIDIH